MNETTNSLGERLYNLRNEHKITQEELAEILNVSRQTISNWENDKVRLDVEKAAALCRLYEMSMDELFLGKEFKPVKNTSKSGFKIIFYIVLLVFFIALIIISTVFLATAKEGEQASSVIYLGKSAWWIVSLVCGAAGCAVLVWFIAKHFKNK